MTMLDQMRRHMGWLKWSLGLVVLAFVIFYIPDFLRGSDAGAAAGDTVATINGREITAGSFRRRAGLGSRRSLRSSPPVFQPPDLPPGIAFAWRRDREIPRFPPLRARHAPGACPPASHADDIAFGGRNPAPRVARSAGRAPLGEMGTVPIKTTVPRPG